MNDRSINCIANIHKDSLAEIVDVLIFKRKNTLIHRLARRFFYGKHRYFNTHCRKMINAKMKSRNDSDIMSIRLFILVSIRQNLLIDESFRDALLFPVWKRLAILLGVSLGAASLTIIRLSFTTLQF